MNFLNVLLPATDGNYYNITSSDYFTRDRIGTLLVFTSIQCPYALQYYDLVQMLSRKRDFKNIAFAFINANQTIDEDVEDLDDMKMAFPNISIPFLRDANKAICSQLNATFTPEYFLLDNNRTTIISGQIDDRFRTPDEWSEGAEGFWPWDDKLPESPIISNLEIVLGAYVNNIEIPKLPVKRIGCSIK